jgi:hypothetical protein
MGFDPATASPTDPLYLRWHAMQDIANERQRQTTKWGDDTTNQSGAALFAAHFADIVLEEIGEVARARQEKDRFMEYEELAQVAAVCVRRMEQLLLHGITNRAC